VRRSRDRASDADVPKRSEIVQGQVIGVQCRSKPAVGHRRVERHCAALLIDNHVVGHVVQADQHVAVGDLVERMTRADHSDTRGLIDELPNRIQAAGARESALIGTRRCRPSCAQPPAHRRTTASECAISRARNVVVSAIPVIDISSHLAG
jgi:hypothetical protein